MGKTLRNILFSSIIAGSLLFTNCGIKNIPKEASEKITGEEDAYDKALEFARESITGKTIEAEKKSGIIEKVLEPRTIENYFLQGKELEGVVLAPESYGLERFLHHFDGKSFNGKNPFILKEEKGKELNLKAFGIAFYLLPKKDKDTEIWNGTEEAELYIKVQKITSDNFENLVISGRPGIYKPGAFNYNVLFFKDYVGPDRLYPYNTQVNITIQGITTKEQVITYINCLKNYQQRIGAELITKWYPGGTDKWLGENFIPWLEKMKKAINNPSDYDFNSFEEVIQEITRMDNFSY